LCSTHIFSYIRPVIWIWFGMLSISRTTYRLLYKTDYL
jgi:hypothetical protein